jgi:hypothetical protein
MSSLWTGLCEYSLGFQESQFGERVKHDALLLHLVEVAWWLLYGYHLLKATHDCHLMMHVLSQIYVTPHLRSSKLLYAM